jgi:hypothetical protein
MSLETRAKEAALRAKGEAMSVEAPESDEIVRERRARQRARVGVVSTVVVLIVAMGVVALVASRQDTSAPPESHPVPKAKLEFREVLAQLPYAGADLPVQTGPGTTATCENGKAVTPAAKVTPEAHVTLPDRPDKHGKHFACYVLGPVLFDGSGIATAQPTLDPAQGWLLLVHFGNEDSLTKVARPEVNKQVAILLNDVVVSAPTIQPGIVGRDVQITGNFTEAEAKDLAASLMGVQPSQITVPTTTPTTTHPPTPGLVLGGLPACPSYKSSAPENCRPQFAFSTDVATSAIRHDKTLGWVIDLTLKPNAQVRLAHMTSVGATIDGFSAEVSEHANRYTLSSLRPPIGTPWTQATAVKLAQDIKDGN